MPSPGPPGFPSGLSLVLLLIATLAFLKLFLSQPEGVPGSSKDIIRNAFPRAPSGFLLPATIVFLKLFLSQPEGVPLEAQCQKVKTFVSLLWFLEHRGPCRGECGAISAILGTYWGILGAIFGPRLGPSCGVLEKARRHFGSF